MRLKQISNDSKESNFFAFLEYAYSVIKNSQPIFESKSKKHNDFVYKQNRLLVSNEKLESLYFEAKDVYKCLLDGVDFNYFIKLMCFNDPQKQYYKNQKKHYRFYDCHHCDFREKISFVKNKTSISKKENSNKKEWREFKKVKKDKSRKHHNRGPDAQWKQFTHQSYRAYIRQLIKNERYDDVFQKSEKLYLDPWDWD